MNILSMNIYFIFYLNFFIRKYYNDNESIVKMYYCYVNHINLHITIIINMFKSHIKIIYSFYLFITRRYVKNCE